LPRNRSSTFSNRIRSEHRFRSAESNAFAGSLHLAKLTAKEGAEMQTRQPPSYWLPLYGVRPQPYITATGVHLFANEGMTHDIEF